MPMEHNNLVYIDCLVQECSNSSALTIELLQTCTKPSIQLMWYFFYKIISTGKFKLNTHFYK